MGRRWISAFSRTLPRDALSVLRGVTAAVTVTSWVGEPTLSCALTLRAWPISSVISVSVAVSKPVCLTVIL